MADEEQAEEGILRVKVDRDPLHCRYYENVFPELEEVVVVNVTEIGEMGAYVTLLEYDDIEGMILLSELSRRRIRSINKLVRVNRNEIVMVIRVDKEKGYIDLSKRRVEPGDVLKCEERFNKAKAVHSILRHIAHDYKVPLEEIYTKIGWPLYRKHKHAYDAFKTAMSDPDVDVFEGLDVDPEMAAAVLAYVKKRLASQPIKIRADVELTCFSYEGIDAIKASLLCGEARGTTEAPVKIKLIAPPLYYMTSSSFDKELGIQVLTDAIEAIRVSITSFGGVMEVKLAPKAVTQREELELQAMLNQLALEQEDVDGDEPEEC